ncbi:hypothetical protein ACFX2U_08050 [Gilliamella apicola]|uniref:hypothetical protein n=1 Tax=Gilliamella apicola TaxID=1196095 RepID=UPI0039859492
MKKNFLVVSLIGLFALCFNVYADEDLVKTQYQSSPNKVYAEGKQPQITVANYNIAGGLRKHKMDLDLVANAIKAKLKGLTPVEYRNQALQTA